MTRLGLRTQLLLPTCILLAAPLLAFFWFTQYTSELNTIQEAALKTNTQVLQKILQKEAQLDDEILDLDRFVKTQDLYAPQLDHSIILDGKITDWPSTPGVHYGKTELISIDYPYTEESLEFELKMGLWEKNLFLFISVKDDHVIYRELKNLSIHRNDHIRILLFDKNGKAQRYTIAPFQPSKTSAYILSTTGRALRPEPRISGTWSATNKGYDLEIKIPEDMLSKQFAISVADVDSEATRINQYLMGSGSIDKPGSLQLPSKNLTLLLSEFPFGKLSILDSHKRLIAESGSANNSTDPLLEMYLKQGNLSSNLLSPDQLSKGNQDSGSNLTQAITLSVDNKQIGILEIKQSRLGFDLVKTAAKNKLYIATSLLLIVGLLFWLLTSTLIIRRITKLSTAVENAVDSQGRASKSIPQTKDRDELGDLSRSFSNMVNRLQQYNAYLEAMAGRLAHELRTPVSVVRSSLENLNLEDQTPENKTYLERANNGIYRLSSILNKMSEATRLEQSLDEDEVETFNLVKVVEGCVKGYEQAYPQFKFNLSVETEPLMLTGIPDLIAQLLDKLVNNACEFASSDSTIKLRITEDKREAILRVINDGKSLPEEMQDKLFDSMVSVRSNKKVITDALSTPMSNNPDNLTNLSNKWQEGDIEKKEKVTHLGLGLYIAKVITHFHGGNIKIANREDTTGVIVTVSIPLMRLTSKL